MYIINYYLKILIYMQFILFGRYIKYEVKVENIIDIVLKICIRIKV